MNYYICIFLLLNIIHCGFINAENQFSTSVIENTPAELYELPHQISIRNVVHGHFCGGTLLTESLIVTAAHCVVNSNGNVTDKNQLKIVAGTLSISKFSDAHQIRNVFSITPHKNYNPVLYKNDIALIKVNPPFKLSRSVNILPLRKFESLDGETCLVSGWGKGAKNGSTSAVLMKITVPLLNRDTCRTPFRKLNITDRMICVDYNKGQKDACQGDSGGPLSCSGFLVGVSTFGEGCIRPKHPGVYTYVYRYLTWIKENKATNNIQNPFVLVVFVLFSALYKKIFIYY